MTRADFAIVSFQEHLGDGKEEAVFEGLAFVGVRSSEKEFAIEGVPFGRGYIALQLAFVEEPRPEVFLNGERVGASSYQHGVTIFGENLLKRGTNTIQIGRADGGDDFAIHDVVIHWREKEPIREALRSIFESMAADKKEP
jgi:hypothetical protein